MKKIFLKIRRLTAACLAISLLIPSPAYAVRPADLKAGTAAGSQKILEKLRSELRQLGVVTQNSTGYTVPSASVPVNSQAGSLADSQTGKPAHSNRSEVREKEDKGRDLAYAINSLGIAENLIPTLKAFAKREGVERADVEKWIPHSLEVLKNFSSAENVTDELWMIQGQLARAALWARAVGEYSLNSHLEAAAHGWGKFLSQCFKGYYDKHPEDVQKTLGEILMDLEALRVSVGQTDLSEAQNRSGDLKKDFEKIIHKINDSLDPSSFTMRAFSEVMNSGANASYSHSLYPSIFLDEIALQLERGQFNADFYRMAKLSRSFSGHLKTLDQIRQKWNALLTKVLEENTLRSEARADQEAKMEVRPFSNVQSALQHYPDSAFKESLYASFPMSETYRGEPDKENLDSQKITIEILPGKNSRFKAERIGGDLFQIEWDHWTPTLSSEDEGLVFWVYLDKDASAVATIRSPFRQISIRYLILPSGQQPRSEVRSTSTAAAKTPLVRENDRVRVERNGNQLSIAIDGERLDIYTNITSNTAPTRTPAYELYRWLKDRGIPSDTPALDREVYMYAGGILVAGNQLNVGSVDRAKGDYVYLSRDDRSEVQMLFDSINKYLPQMLDSKRFIAMLKRQGFSYTPEFHDGHSEEGPESVQITIDDELTLHVSRYDTTPHGLPPILPSNFKISIHNSKNDVLLDLFQNSNIYGLFFNPEGKAKPLWSEKVPGKDSELLAEQPSRIADNPEAVLGFAYQKPSQITVFVTPETLQTIQAKYRKNEFKISTSGGKAAITINFLQSRSEVRGNAVHGTEYTVPSASVPVNSQAGSLADSQTGKPAHSNHSEVRSKETNVQFPKWKEPVWLIRTEGMKLLAGQLNRYPEQNRLKLADLTAWENSPNQFVLMSKDGKQLLWVDGRGKEHEYQVESDDFFVIGADGVLARVAYTGQEDRLQTAMRANYKKGKRLVTADEVLSRSEVRETKLDNNQFAGTPVAKNPEVVTDAVHLPEIQSRDQFLASQVLEIEALDQPIILTPEIVRQGYVAAFRGMMKGKIVAIVTDAKTREIVQRINNGLQDKGLQIVPVENAEDALREARKDKSEQLAIKVFAMKNDLEQYTELLREQLKKDFKVYLPKELDTMVNRLGSDAMTEIVARLRAEVRMAVAA